MTASELSEQASLQLARRLQEEEDLLVAFQLQEQISVPVSHFSSRDIPIRDVIANRNVCDDSVLCLTSSDDETHHLRHDEEEVDDDDVQELSFVSLSDSDRSSPLVRNSVLNNAFSIDPTNRGMRDDDEDDVIILNDSFVSDIPPPPRDDDDNIVLTVGRTTRSQTRHIANSISITNNLPPAPATTTTATRSRTRDSSDSNSRGEKRTRSARSPVTQPSSRQPSSTAVPSSSASTSHTRPRGRQHPVISSSDNLPSTSSGRRRALHHHQSRSSRPHSPVSSISSRVIINGVPLQGIPHSQFTSGGVNFLNHFQQFSHHYHDGMLWDESMTYEDMIALDDANTLMPGQGLSSHAISSNTVTKTYSKTEGSSDSCNICLCEFDGGEKVRTLPCFHLFHLGCIDNWLSRKPECPVCRLKVGG